MKPGTRPAGQSSTVVRARQAPPPRCALAEVNHNRHRGEVRRQTSISSTRVFRHPRRRHLRGGNVTSAPKATQRGGSFDIRTGGKRKRAKVGTSFTLIRNTRTIHHKPQGLHPLVRQSRTAGLPPLGWQGFHLTIIAAASDTQFSLRNQGETPNSTVRVLRRPHRRYLNEAGLSTPRRRKRNGPSGHVVSKRPQFAGTT